MADLVYIDGGLFTTFTPETKAGEVAFAEICNKNDGIPKVYSVHLQSTLQQLRKAGYSVTKAKPQPKLSEIEIDRMLNDLLS